MSGRRIDLLAVTGAVLALVMAVVYVAVVRGQDEPPLWWVLAVLVLAAALAAAGSVVRLDHSRALLVGAGALLLALGVLAILTIGLPIIVAGALCLVAGARRGRRARTDPQPAPR